MHRCDPTRPEALLGGASHAMPPPERLLDLLPLCPTLVIGDIGRGPGFLTLPLAARVPQGHVHVVDIAPTMRDTVRDRAAAGRANITMHLARSGVVPLPPGCLDGALLTLAFLFLPVAERVGFLARLRTLVRPGGWLAILEWECRQNPGAGPPLAARVTPEDTRAALARAGWRALILASPNEWLYFVLAGHGPATTVSPGDGPSPDTLDRDAAQRPTLGG